MSLLEDLQTTLAEMDIPVETGIFSDKAPEQYLVIIPLADTFDLHADNAPGVDVQEARRPCLQQAVIRLPKTS